MLFIDTFEPQDIEILVGQSVPTMRSALNNQGYADYMWMAHDGHRVQVERKQCPEILGGIDKVEEQLGRELQNGVEETMLLVEGVCEPVAKLKLATQTWVKKSGKGAVMVPGRAYNCSYTGMQAWFNRLDKAGVTLVQTFDYVATAMTLVALYGNSQKVDHSTLRRYIKERINIPDFNPQVVSLMGIKGGGLGEAKAKAIIDRYGTFWYAISQPAEELADTLVGNKRLGISSVNKLFKAIGKTQ